MCNYIESSLEDTLDSSRTQEKICLQFHFDIGCLVPNLKSAYIVLDPLTTRERCWIPHVYQIKLLCTASAFTQKLTLTSKRSLQDYTRKVWPHFLQFTDPCFYYFKVECSIENSYLCHIVHIIDLFQHCMTSAACSLCWLTRHEKQVITVSYLFKKQN